MIEWSLENTYYLAAIISSVIFILLYYLFLRKE